MSQPAGQTPIIHVSPMGNLANHMIQYMVARSLAARVGACTISAVGLPGWDIEHPPVEGAFPATEIVTDPRPDLDRLAAALREGTLQRVDLRTYGQCIQNFLPAAAYRDVFVYSGPELAGAGPDEVLCNIRQGDILDGHHPDYVLIPADFYEELARTTGLGLVFSGQIEDSPYMTELRRRFPKARFLPSAGPLGDFERIRRSVHVMLSVSTFSWLAAWLSDAKTVFMPILGLLHPLQSTATDLLPHDDPRFRFYLFPFHYAVPVAQAAFAHAALRGLWRLVPAARLDVLRHPAPRRDSLAQYLEHFDETHYRAAYPDIAAAVDTHLMPSCRHHYEHYGFAEGREGFRLDKSWYCRRYPIAAIELGQGDYAHPHQHWIEIGRTRGYQCVPGERAGR